MKGNPPPPPESVISLTQQNPPKGRNWVLQSPEESRKRQQNTGKQGGGNREGILAQLSGREEIMHKGSTGVKRQDSSLERDEVEHGLKGGEVSAEQGSRVEPLKESADMDGRLVYTNYVYITSSSFRSHYFHELRIHDPLTSKSSSS